MQSAENFAQVFGSVHGMNGMNASDWAWQTVEECRRLVAADGGVFAGMDQDDSGMVVKGGGGVRYRLLIKPVRIERMAGVCKDGQ
jgi:hypothetical protein